MPHVLPIAHTQAPALLRAAIAPVSYPIFLGALGLATILPLGIAAYAAARPRAQWAHWGVALVQAVVALNVLSHLTAAAVVRGYAPGVATAIIVNLPFSAYFFRRAAREGWLTRRGRWWLLPAAVVVHGPGLVGIFALSRLLMRT